MSSSKPKYFLVWWMESKETEILPARRVPPRYQKKGAVFELYREDIRNKSRCRPVDPNRPKGTAKVLAYDDIKLWLSDIKVDREGNILQNKKYVTPVTSPTKNDDDKKSIDVIKKNTELTNKVIKYNDIESYFNLNDNESQTSIFMNKDNNLTCTNTSYNTDIYDEENLIDYDSDDTISVSSDDNFEGVNCFIISTPHGATFRDSEFRDQLMEKVNELNQHHLHNIN